MKHSLVGARALSVSWSRRVFSVLALLATTLFNPAAAQDAFFAAPAGGAYDDAATWLDDSFNPSTTAPGPNDILGFFGSGDIDFNSGNTSSFQVFVVDGASSWNLNNTTHTVADQLVIGLQNIDSTLLTGELSFTDGSIIAPTLLMGTGGARGRLNLETAANLQTQTATLADGFGADLNGFFASESIVNLGVASTWTNTNELIIGRRSRAQVNVTDGAALTTGSLTLGQSAVADLGCGDCTDPADGTLFIGANAFSATEQSSVEVTNDTIVGAGGNGLIDMQGGGRFNTADLYAGLEGGNGIINVDGAGTTLSAAAILLGADADTINAGLVPAGATAQLNITNGATVLADDELEVAGIVGTDASVVVSGADSFLSSRVVRVGFRQGIDSLATPVVGSIIVDNGAEVSTLATGIGGSYDGGVGRNETNQMMVDNGSTYRSPGGAVLGGDGGVNARIAGGSTVMTGALDMAEDTPGSSIGSSSTAYLSIEEASRWDVDGNFSAGIDGEAQIFVDNSTLTNGNARLGANAGSLGEISLSNSAVWDSAGSVDVGVNGCGTISATDSSISSGAVTLGGDCSFGTANASLNNSAWAVNGDVDVTDNASLFFTNGSELTQTGRLNILDGSLRLQSSDWSAERVRVGDSSDVGFLEVGRAGSGAADQSAGILDVANRIDVFTGQLVAFRGVINVGAQLSIRQGGVRTFSGREPTNDLDIDFTKSVVISNGSLNIGANPGDGISLLIRDDMGVYDSTMNLAGDLQLGNSTVGDDVATLVVNNSTVTSGDVFMLDGFLNQAGGSMLSFVNPDQLLIRRSDWTNNGNFSLGSSNSSEATIEDSNITTTGGVEVARRSEQWAVLGSDGSDRVPSSGQFRTTANTSGPYPAPSGDLTIRDGSNWDIAGNFTVGSFVGPSSNINEVGGEVIGTVRQQTNSTVNVGGDLELFSQNSSYTVTGGSTLNVAGELRPAVGSEFVLNDGAVFASLLRIRDGDFRFQQGQLTATNVLGNLTVGEGAGESIFAGQGVFGDLNNNGTVRLIDDGVFVDQLTVSGNFTQSGAAPGTKLSLVLAGLDPVSYQSLDVGGTASLDGTLELLLGDDLFGPVLGDTFDVLSAENITGEFSSLDAFALSSGLLWEIDYLIDFSGTTDVVRLTVAAVPVPAAVWLFASALALLGWRGRGRVSRPAASLRSA